MGSFQSTTIKTSVDAANKQTGAADQAIAYGASSNVRNNQALAAESSVLSGLSSGGAQTITKRDTAGGSGLGSGLSAGGAITQTVNITDQSQFSDAAAGVVFAALDAARSSSDSALALAGRIVSPSTVEEAAASPSSPGVLSSLPWYVWALMGGAVLLYLARK